MSLPLGLRDLPPPLPLRKLLGPSFIILGLGLGSGEIILWPYLTSNYGLGLVWAIVIGVTMQFFINMEVERYALIYGESIFVGFARWLRLLPLWFILSTFLGFGWPGIGLAGATLITEATGSPSLKFIAICLFLLIGLILSAGKQLYRTVETLQKYLILFGTPFILLLVFFLARATDWIALGRGLFGIGRGFHFLPADLSLPVFLAALAFSGAGGNLNLAQSFYIRDKGYGMGKYSDHIGNLFKSASSPATSLTGSTFPLTSNNLSKFHRWWEVVNLEHFLVFWALGLITMLGLAFLAYTTAYGMPGNTNSIHFVINEAAAIAGRTFPVLEFAFLAVTGLMLTATQLTVLDSTSRIITENILLTRGAHISNITRLYYLVLWGQIFFGITIILLGFTQPRQLIVTSANINAFAMFVYSGLLLYLNNFRLPHALRPSPVRNIFLLGTCLFFGFLCLLAFT